MGIRIITDSTSDINQEQASKLNLTIVPLKVLFGDKEYREGIDISMEGFYERLVQSEKLPTTSQPSPNDFLEYFAEAKEAKDSVIVILISSKLSGTVQSAMIAKEMVEYSDIYIIDSLTTITGMRILIEHAVKIRDEGKSAKEIVDTVEELKDKIVFLAMVDTLEFLYKGGRLSKSSAILGSLLNFKPVITLQDGVIGVVGKARGVNNGLAKMLSSVAEMGDIDTNYPVKFGFTAENEKCKLLIDRVKNQYQIKEYGMYPVGCVVGTHAGPGACVITYVKKV
ncbi:MAG: DegV family protein [Herbinix sp.]|nr:DegV family protein [Herbinix sp.]